MFSLILSCFNENTIVAATISIKIPNTVNESISTILLSMLFGKIEAISLNVIVLKV